MIKMYAFLSLIPFVAILLLVSKSFDWAEKHEANKRKRRIEEDRRREFEELKAEHPEWAAELDPAEEKEKKDREEFERLAKEHPEWL